MKPDRNHQRCSRIVTRRLNRFPTEGRLVFVDLELAPVGRRRIILQIAAVAVSQSLVELEAFEAKIRVDERRIRPSRITNRHFDVQTWRDEGRSSKSVAWEFAQFLRRHAATDVTGSDGRPLMLAQLVAHNAEFDGTFLREWFEGLGLFFPASYRVFCTLHRAMWYFHEDRMSTPPPDFKLATLCRYFRVPFPAEEAHDALADVRATVELYRRISLLNAACVAQSLN